MGRSGPCGEAEPGVSHDRAPPAAAGTIGSPDGHPAWLTVVGPSCTPSSPFVRTAPPLGNVARPGTAIRTVYPNRLSPACGDRPTLSVFRPINSTHDDTDGRPHPGETARHALRAATCTSRVDPAPVTYFASAVPPPSIVTGRRPKPARGPAGGVLSDGRRPHRNLRKAAPPCAQPCPTAELPPSRGSRPTLTAPSSFPPPRCTPPRPQQPNPVRRRLMYGKLPVTGLGALTVGGVAVARPVVALVVAAALIAAGLALWATGRRRQLTAPDATDRSS
jgi:hypothetical protein